MSIITSAFGRLRAARNKNTTATASSQLADVRGRRRAALSAAAIPAVESLGPASS